MAECLIFIRLKENISAGRGANRGDIVSMRPATARITSFEKKNFCILKIVDMTESEILILTQEIHPRANLQILTEEPEDDGEAESWKAAIEAERSKLPVYGKQVKLDSSNFSSKELADIDNLSKECEPIVRPKTIIESKSITEER